MLVTRTNGLTNHIHIIKTPLKARTGFRQSAKLTVSAGSALGELTGLSAPPCPLQVFSGTPATECKWANVFPLVLGVL